MTHVADHHDDRKTTNAPRCFMSPLVRGSDNDDASASFSRFGIEPQSIDVGEVDLAGERWCPRYFQGPRAQNCRCEPSLVNLRHLAESLDLVEDTSLHSSDTTLQNRSEISSSGIFIERNRPNPHDRPVESVCEAHVVSWLAYSRADGLTRTPSGTSAGC